MKKSNDFKTARVYAKALYESAEAEGDLQKVFSDVETLKSIELSKLKESSCFLSPIVELKVKYEIVEAVVQKLGFCRQTLNMLKILIENGQFGILEMLLVDFTEIYNKKHNIAEISVETVGKLEERQDALLKNKLTEIFKKQVKINYVIKPEILGGLVIKNGTELIDLSLKNKLQKIEQLMKGTD